MQTDMKKRKFTKEQKLQIIKEATEQGVDHKLLECPFGVSSLIPFYEVHDTSKSHILFPTIQNRGLYFPDKQHELYFFQGPLYLVLRN